jgi:hypothetical protein
MSRAPLLGPAVLVPGTLAVVLAVRTSRKRLGRPWQRLFARETPFLRWRFVTIRARASVALPVVAGWLMTLYSRA